MFDNALESILGRVEPNAYTHSALLKAMGERVSHCNHGFGVECRVQGLGLSA